MKAVILIPAYKPDFHFIDFVKELKEKNLPMLVVNDGSKDSTYAELKKLYSEHSECVSVVNLSRNFGQAAAKMAGVSVTTVSFVLNNKPGVSDAIRKNIQDIINSKKGE